MRKIDIFTHIMPTPYHTLLTKLAPDFADVGKRMRGVPMLTDLDLRFRVMDAFESYQQILSLPTPPIEAMVSGEDAVDLARAANDGMAELVHRHPARFPGFVASLPLGDPAAAILRTVDEQKIDMIVAGALEKEVVLHPFLGNVARRLVREANCSVMLFTQPNTEPMRPVPKRWT